MNPSSPGGVLGPGAAFSDRRFPLLLLPPAGCLCMDFEVCGLDLFSDFPEKEIYGVLEFVFLMRDVQEKV